MTTKQKKTYYNKVIDKIVKDAKKQKSDLKRVKLIHDRLAERITYDYDTFNNTKKYNYASYHKEGAILNGTAVCQGYAEAFQDVLNKVGIENKFISSREMNHAWNQVKIGSQFYAVDLTWDDGGDLSNDYTNFLLDNKTLQERGHQKYRPTKYQKATDTRYVKLSIMLDPYIYPIIKEDDTGYYSFGSDGIFGTNLNGKVKVFQSFPKSPINYPIGELNGNVYYNHYERDTGIQEIIKISTNLKKRETVWKGRYAGKAEFDAKNRKVTFIKNTYSDELKKFIDEITVVNL